MPFCQICSEALQPCLPPCAACGFPEIDGEPHVCVSQRTDPVVPIHALGMYGGPMAEAIARLKYGGKSHFAARLGNLLAELALQRQLEFDCVVPVPLDSVRLRERGYNQSALLARVLTRRLNAMKGSPAAVLAFHDAIWRTQIRERQSRLSRQRRLTNLRDSFSANTKVLQGARILIVDDVLTTGATVIECARAAMEVGSAGVAVLTLAYTLP